MLDKKYNFACCISKIDEKAMCEFKFACFSLQYWQKADVWTKSNNFA